MDNENGSAGTSVVASNNGRFFFYRATEEAL